MKVLVVEDNRELADTIRSSLQREGYTVEAVETYTAAVDKLIDASYDLVVLDIMLPDGNGLDVLRMIRQEYPQTGTLIISAKNALDDRLEGLELGADDYLTKPFHLSELNARLRAIYRRRYFEGSDIITFNEISINTGTMEVSVNDKPLTLTKKEYELLLFFLANRNRLLTKQAIAEHLWGEEIDLYDSFDFIYQHIKNLRKKIARAGGKDYLNTIYGMGYKFNTRIA